MVTQQQLQSVIDKSNQLAQILSQIIHLATVAQSQQLEGAVIDATTQTALLNQYATLKAQLVSVFNSLP